MQSSSQGFWDQYLECVRRAGVPEEQQRWYLHWAERFARAFRGLTLRERSVTDIRSFIDDLRNSEKIASWQVEQARKAIALLYREHLGIRLSELPPVRTSGTDRDRAAPREHTLKRRHGPVLKAMRDAIRTKHFSPRTEAAYLGWIKRFLVFHDMQDPRALGAKHIREYLTYLATQKGVASSTQNVALNAIVFFYRKVLDRPPGDFSGFSRAKMPRRVPATLSTTDMAQLLEQLSDPFDLMAMLMYGAGLRVMECLRLRIADLDTERHQLRVQGKGNKQRITVLPEVAMPELQRQVARAKLAFEEDHAFDLTLTWEQQFLFPAVGLRVDPETRQVKRQHLSRNGVSKALSSAAQRAGLTTRVTPHVLRHSFASQLIADGVNERIVQELMGHASLRTTMIYTHPMNGSRSLVVSPLQKLRGRA